jgi:hypothetical protein
MRNVFDQYKSVENRVTHALATALSEDRRLLRSFLRTFAPNYSPPRTGLLVEEQKLPGEPALSEDEVERRGLPDAWIHDGENWALLIESKITAAVRTDQLRRHLRTAARRGFQHVRLVLITATPYGGRLPPRAAVLHWQDIYSWLTRESPASPWAQRVAAFLEIEEVRMAEREGSFDGSMTRFTGFPFGPDRPYEYGEAKRVLGLAMLELRKRRDLKRQLDMDPDGEGRPAITGRGAPGVWDFLSIRKARKARPFTAYPHLTLALETDRAFAHVTLPNGMSPPLRKQLRSLSFNDFAAILANIERRLRPVARAAKGAAPWFVGVQRRYATQNAIPIIDARLEFDLRTLDPKSIRGRDRVKSQPALAQAAYEALQNRGPNYQMAVGLIMPYRTCRASRQPKVLDLVARTWIGCKPIP